ncbi:MAG: zf-HC2 domain-containing protein [Armatimonadetes bacterium]|nr:zf-HC2 domain-containing protein [Armatimonadota bacterium]
MQVKNVECQIAQAQMRRYLAGEEMPLAIVSDLEAHLKGCADCMAAAQLERQSLASVLTNRITGQSRRPASPAAPAPQSPIPFATKLAPKRLQPGKASIQAPIDIFDAPDEQYAPDPKKKKKSINLKTVAYSLGLALILVLMSTVMKDPTAIFGPRAVGPNTDTPPQAQEETTPPANTDAGNENVGAKKPAESGDKAPDTTSSPKPADTPAATIADDLPDKPMLGNEIIIADSEKGTRVVREPVKGSGEPRNGTIKVYPPAKK